MIGSFRVAKSEAVKHAALTVFQISLVIGTEPLCAGLRVGVDEAPLGIVGVLAGVFRSPSTQIQTGDVPGCVR